MTTSPDKPKALAVCTANIPAEMQASPRWLLWRYRVKEGRWTKLPCMKNGGIADVTDPSSWCSFQEAVAAYGAGDTFDGIGFALNGSDDIVGIDLDKLKEHQNQPAVVDIFEALTKSGTYIERSPSGKGLHAFLRGSMPFAGKNNRVLGVEIYASGRYLTVTGQRLDDAGQDIVADQLTIDGIVGLAFPALAAVQFGAANIPAPAMSASASISDEGLINLARKAKNGEAFSLLWGGEREEYYRLQNKPVSSHSETDFALCCSLAFWTGKDPVRIDRLFRQSSLMRPKWDEQHGTTTYGQRTIANAIPACTDCYTPRNAPSLSMVANDAPVVPESNKGAEWTASSRMSGVTTIILAGQSE
jgi:putative DNA primase/helicase